MPSTDQPKSFLERDNWFKAVLESNLSHIAVRVALAIGAHLHVKSGRCDPSFAGIAVASHVSERTVYRLVSLLEQTGWIAMRRTGGRQRNQYTLLNPDTVLSVSNHDKAQSGFDDADTDTALSVSTLTERASNPDTTVAVKKRRTAKKEREGKNIYAASDVALRDAGQDEREPEEKKRTARARSGNFVDNKRHCVNDVTDLDTAFAEFWSVYPLKKSKAAAEKAFAAAIRRGVDPAVMLAGAARYAAERNGQDRKFTKHPARWINDECWHDEAITDAVTIDEHGNVIEAPEQSTDDDEVEAMRARLAGTWGRG